MTIILDEVDLKATEAALDNVPFRSDKLSYEVKDGILYIYDENKKIVCAGNPELLWEFFAHVFRER